jgi:plasmid maintenance system antidote protein VapI
MASVQSPRTPRFASSRLFGTSAEFWINLEGQNDIEVTEQKEHDQLESVHRLRNRSYGVLMSRKIF